MRFKTLPIFTLATYRMGSNFSIRVTPNINLITVGLTQATAQYFLRGLKGYQVPNIDSSYKDGFGAKYFSWTTYLIRVRCYDSSYNQMCNFV